MKLMFMFCNNCMAMIHTKHWIVDNRRCTCIFLEEAKPIDLISHTMSIYAQAVEADRLLTQEMLKTMSPEQINQFCFENGYAVPEPKEKK